MPGKQMAIDAELRGGTIDGNEAAPAAAAPPAREPATARRHGQRASLPSIVPPRNSASMAIARIAIGADLAPSSLRLLLATLKDENSRADGSAQRALDDLAVHLFVSRGAVVEASGNVLDADGVRTRPEFACAHVGACP